jgi:hypothetical protein
MVVLAEQLPTIREIAHQQAAVVGVVLVEALPQH